VANSGAKDEPDLFGGVGAAEFRERRRRLRAACPDGLLIVRGGTEEEAPAGSRYRQNNAFFYLTGVEAPGAFLALLPDHVPAPAGARGTSAEVRELLFLPARDPVAETWTGPKLGPGPETEALTGMTILNSANFVGACTEWIRRCPRVGTLTPFGPNARLTREATLMAQIADHAPAVQFFSIAPCLAALRAVKSPGELAQLEHSIAVTMAGQEEARRVIARGAGKREYEVEAAIFAAFRSRGAVNGFPAIVGAGLNATVLHYEDNDQLLREGDLVVVDIGARHGRYSGDITRTYPVGGKFAPRQREIYDLVLAAHRNVIATYRPGEDTLQALNDRCKQFLQQSPLRARNQSGTEQTMDMFMPHRLGHHLGLDVHDLTALLGSNSLGLYGEDGFEKPLTPGAVITVEPGVYIPSESLGVRLEDDYLVTETGLERLGPPLAIESDEVEALMQAMR
jgi:Xaa-Pro aminopeptidase